MSERWLQNPRISIHDGNGYAEMVVNAVKTNKGLLAIILPLVGHNETFTQQIIPLAHCLAFCISDFIVLQ
jgi:hypothetical protein